MQLITDSYSNRICSNFSCRSMDFPSFQPGRADATEEIELLPELEKLSIDCAPVDKKEDAETF